MSGNKTTPKKTLKEMEDEIIAQRQAQYANASPFARADEIRRERESQAPRQFRVATEADMERRRQMQQPQPVIQPPAASTGLISATLLRSRLVRAANEKQAKFFSLLEEKYGAIKGNERSYLEAMDRYHNDKDRKKEETRAKTPFEKLEEFRLKQEKKASKRQEQERMQKEQERMQKEEEQRHQRAYDEHVRQFQSRQYQQQPGWEQWQKQEERRKQQEWEQWQRFKQQQQEQHHRQQYHQQQSYARGGPAPAPEPEPRTSPRAKSGNRYPSPHSRAEALAVMGLNPRADVTDRDIKQAFNKKALLLHPDKNLDNPEEAGNRFKQLHSAFKFLKKQSGGSRRNKQKMLSKKNKRKSSRKSSKKYYKKSYKKSYKKFNKNK